ncbi:MAG: CotH kinase family protein [Muribaculaceae bacterium]|nr:CotH kinase family protein [Muribaculaceae bacterium]
MKQLSFRNILAALLVAVAAPALFASDPQLFIYRNDGGFNSTHLSQGTGITHSLSAGGLMMHLLDDKSKVTDIPVSAIDSCVVRLADIPTLHISLTDYPDRTDLWDKELYLNCTLDIEGNGYCDDSQGLSLTVRGRGNSTWSMPKKPMRLKFPKKISLFGFAKQKNYVLLANYIDDSLMKNAVAFWIARRLGVPYANHTVPVNVEINGVPRGSYLVTEKVGINSGSVDIDETKGILFELSVEYDEPYKFRTDLWNLPVMVKDPDFDEIAQDNPDGPSPDGLLDLWKNDFNRALRLLSAGQGAQAFDMDSFVRGIMLYNICLNNEIGHKKSL